MTENTKELTIEQIAELESVLLDELIEKARTDFYTFVRIMAPVVLPEEFIDGVHIKIICDRLQQVMESVSDTTRDPERQQIFLPPGAMKSKIGSNLFPAFCLGLHPNWCFLAIGADYNFAVDNLGRPTKEIIDSEKYRAIFPGTILKKDVKSADRWYTTKKGVFVSRGAGQNIAGRRAHITLCDDLISEQTTATGRKEINKWYRKGLRSRLLPRGAEVIINTRWAVDDISGFMLGVDAKSKRPWNVISIPALVDEVTSEMLREGLPDDDPRFAVGTSFWPELWPTDNFLEKQATMPPIEWNALYMQRPVLEDGGVVKKDQWKVWEDIEAPQCKYVIVSMDTGYEQMTTSDHSAYTVWGVFTRFAKGFEGVDIAQDCLILLGSDKGRWTYPELLEKAEQLNNDFNPDWFIIENKASGQTLIPELQRRSLPVLPYNPVKDKTSRLHATTPYFMAGRIWVPKDPETGEVRSWAQAVIDEVCSFNPSQKNQVDDLTDTVSQVIIYMRDNYKIDNDGYTNRSEDDIKAFQRHTYWSGLTQKSRFH